MSDDLISRQAAIDRINKQREHLQPDIYPQDKIGDAAYRICAEFIERLPSAQPEIVRCRECENWDKTWTNDWSPEYHYCPMIDGVRKGDFYCADAERRTDE